MTTPGQRGSYAVIPAHNHPETLVPLVTELVAQVDLVIVIDNASRPAISHRELLTSKRLTHGENRAGLGRIWLWRDEEQPPNLTRLWCDGLKAVADDVRRDEMGTRSACEWDVALLNDDVIVEPGWFRLVADSMRETGAAAACTFPGNQSLDQSGTSTRHLYGPAFVLRGELAARAGDPLWPDDRLRWWGQDTLMGIRAQQNGGTLRVNGPLVPNLRANASTTGPLAEQAGRDRETFKEIVGWYGW